MPRNERSRNVLLWAIAILLGANLLVQLNSPAGSRAVAAGIPDSGAQLQAVADQLSDISKKVDKLDSFLESGTLAVTVKNTKDFKDPK